MQTDIHPKYFDKAKVTCACGATFEMGSTLESYRIDVCAKCHPFYTGKQKLVDTAGRVDKFKARQIAAAKRQEAETARAKRRADQAKESAEEKITRKAQEKTEELLAKRAAKAEVKKKIAKKKAAEIVVKKGRKAPTRKAPAKKAPAKKQ